VKGSAAVSRAKVLADGQGVVSHAGVGMLREVADLGCDNLTWLHADGLKWLRLCGRGCVVVSA
jgi:hypothetical protein